MENEEMNNVELNNYLAIGDSNFLKQRIKIDSDKGKLSTDIVRLFERYYNVRLPRLYVRFITKHNGARLENNIFRCGDFSDSCYFMEFGDIISLMESIRYDNEYGYDTYKDGYIPFAEDGGEGILFFDYNKCKDKTEPRVVMISEGEEEFIAESFEEFVKLLVVDHERLEDNLHQIEEELQLRLPESYKKFCIEYCTNKFNKIFDYKYYKLEFMFPDKILWSVSNLNKDCFENIIPFAIDDDNLFCFDYTKTNNDKMPIAICKRNYVLNPHVIASCFEEFVNMLHEPVD